MSEIIVRDKDCRFLIFRRDGLYYITGLKTNRTMRVGSLDDIYSVTQMHGEDKEARIVEKVNLKADVIWQQYQGLAVEVVRCPDWTPAAPQPKSDCDDDALRGCGGTNISGPDDEGMFDCCDCGLFFLPEAPPQGYRTQES